MSITLMPSRIKRVGFARYGTVVVVLALAASACSGGDSAANGTPVPAPAAPAAPQAPADEGLQVVDGVLQPLADGFPSEPITLWNSFAPGSIDDVYNIQFAEAAIGVSPVPINTATQQMGPHLAWDQPDFLRPLSGAVEGYHIFNHAWFGGMTRIFNVASLADRDIWSINPVAQPQAAPYVFIVNPDSEFQTLGDIEEYARANPGELRVVASSACGGLCTTAYAWGNSAGVDFTFIPTDSATESRAVLQGGGAQLGVVSMFPGVIEQFRVLTFADENPLADLPGVLPISELGHSINAATQQGFGTLPEVPAEHVQWLAELIRLVTSTPEWQANYPGWSFDFQGPAQVRASVESSIQVFVPILEELGLTYGRPY